MKKLLLENCDALPCLRFEGGKLTSIGMPAKAGADPATIYGASVSPQEINAELEQKIMTGAAWGTSFPDPLIP